MRSAWAGLRVQKLMPAGDTLPHPKIGYTFLRPNAFMQNLGNREATRIKQQSSFANSVGD